MPTDLKKYSVKYVVTTYFMRERDWIFSVNVEEILQSRNFQKLKYLQITISDFKAK